mgnify:CR=1 FL=1
MRTPYCAAIGVQRREVDQIRISIGVEVDRLTQVERRRTEIELDMLREFRAAAEAIDTPVPSTAYFLMMRAERARLEESQRVIDARVAQLRSEAREAYGSLTAIEGAAARYRDEEVRRVAGAEQAASDDRSAALFVARARSRRSAAGRRQP